jgi:hypothetical protein
MKASNNSNASIKDDERDLILNKDFATAEKQINLALCNCIDTQNAMDGKYPTINIKNQYLYEQRSCSC